MVIYIRNKRQHFLGPNYNKYEGWRCAHLSDLAYEVAIMGSSGILTIHDLGYEGWGCAHLRVWHAS